jgi:hypothetical protein
VSHIPSWVYAACNPTRDVTHESPILAMPRLGDCHALLAGLGDGHASLAGLGDGHASLTGLGDIHDTLFLYESISVV